MHAAAIMGGGAHAGTVLAVSGEEIVVCHPDTALAGHIDRVLLTRADLLDAGVEWNHHAGRFANGSGRRVDELIDDANEQLRRKDS